MNNKKDKFAPAVIQDLCSIFAQKDANAPGYMSGPKLIKLFNSLGFADVYHFPGGIQTPEDNGISRTAYALKRLSELNEAYRIPEALDKLIEISDAAQKMTENLNAVFNQYNLTSPLHVDSFLPKGENNDVVKRPVLQTDKEPLLSIDSKLNIDMNSNMDEVFDNIPAGVKVAFISYSWDDDTHKKWVLKLSNTLIKRGIYTLLDQYLPSGYSLTHFMERGIDIADRVIVVGSIKYLEKSKKQTSGGVTYEDSIISSALMDNIATTKFLPVIHGGTFDKCLPSKLSKRLGFDFSDDANFDMKIDELARAIYNVPECPRPTLGPIPSYKFDDLTEREKNELKASGRDFRRLQDRKWLDRLLENFSFDLMHTYLTNYPTLVDYRVFISSDAWDAIIAQPTFRIYDPKLGQIIQDFHDLWQKAAAIGLPYYSSDPSTHKLKFLALQHDVFVSDEAEKAYYEILKIQSTMKPILKEMSIYIQDNFEIDVEHTSRVFIKSLENKEL